MPKAYGIITYIIHDNFSDYTLSLNENNCLLEMATDYWTRYRDILTRMGTLGRRSNRLSGRRNGGDTTGHASSIKSIVSILEIVFI